MGIESTNYDKLEQHKGESLFGIVLHGEYSNNG